MPTVSGPKSLTRNLHRHSGISSSQATSSISSILVVSSAAAPPTIAQYTIPSRCIGSIASSGRPPLPQITRTPYCAPSPSVKRTLRAEVVVPMQIFSYLPGPSLRTPGAVCNRNAPLRSIGGAMPWSKIRICVRSRMPMMWPSTVTSSPARSSRMASSVVGNVSCLELTVELDFPVGGYVDARATCGPALVVDSDRVQGHVRVRVLDMAGEHGHVAAEAHRADSRLVQQLV